MNLSRRSWALSALTLTLVLGACSTPDDLTAPTLEPQFGTDQDDVGLDVAMGTSGYLYTLTNYEYFYDYYDEYYDDTFYSFGNEVELLRYDKNGNRLWSATVANDDDDDSAYEDPPAIGKSVFADSAGNAYVFFSSVEDTYYETGYFVSKYDATGRLIRKVALGSEANGDKVTDAVADSSGNLYIAKTRSGTTQVNSVAKYSTTGNFVWERSVSVGIPASIAVSANGYIYVGGSTGVSRLTNAGSVSWTKSGAANDIAAVGTNTVYARNLTTVRKLDANGKQLWSKAQSGLSGMVVGDMTTDSSANVYLTGKYSASSSNRDVFTRKLSASSGSTVFTKTFGTSAYDDARGVATVSGSEIYITGATQGSLAHPFRGGENDGYVRKLNSSGSPIWTR